MSATYAEKMKARTDVQIAEDRKRARPDGEKKCSGCKDTFPLSSFFGSRSTLDGLQPCCYLCKRKQHRKYRKRHADRSPSAVERDRKRVRPDGTKSCCTCKYVLPFSQFNEEAGNKDGLHGECRDCKWKKTVAERTVADTMREEKRSVGCTRCGETNTHCIDLHHVDPDTKYRDRNGLTVDPGNIHTKSRLEAELLLVAPMCANCHSDETHRQHTEKHESLVASGDILATSLCTRKHVQRLRDFVNAEKTRRGSCVDCKLEVGIRFHAFDFDHVRGQKVEGICKMVGRFYSREIIALEMTKCDLRCKNCHRLITFARAQAETEMQNLLPK